MELLFKTRSTEYTGPGGLPNGSLDNTGEWKPMTKYLEQELKIIQRESYVQNC